MPFPWFLKRDPHAEVRKNASDFLDDEAAPSLAERIRQHLAICKDCKGFIGTLRATIAALRNLPVEPPPSSIGERARRIAGEG